MSKYLDSARAGSSLRRQIAVITGAIITAFAVFAASSSGVFGATKHTIIIRDDRGGAVEKRAELIEDYKSSGTHIQIRGQYCLSACTMYLGLPNTCISENTIFGFHGPSSQLYGVSLAPSAFEYWSAFMANYYPEPIKTWFIQKARHRTVGFYKVRGAELIGMGIARCVS